MKSLTAFLLLFSGCSSTYTFAQSDSTVLRGVQGVVLKVAPAEYLLNQYPTLTIGAEWLIGTRLGLQGEYGWGRPSFTPEQGDKMRTWLYRLEGRRYFRPHFSRIGRGYLAVEFLHKNSNENKTGTTFTITDGTIIYGERIDFTLSREVYDLRAKAGWQWTGARLVLDVFLGAGLRHTNAFPRGTEGQKVDIQGGMFTSRPGKFTGLYPAMGFKVGWLLFRNK